MKQFNFYIDRKNTVWEREHYVVPAETLKEAKQWMINNWDGGEDYFEDAETLYDTLEPMSPEENNGQQTVEIYSEDEPNYPILTNVDTFNKLVTDLHMRIEFSARYNKEWRKGQNVFNCTYQMFPSIADELRAGPLDCFYIDENVEPFLAHVYNKLAERTGEENQLPYHKGQNTGESGSGGNNDSLSRFSANEEKS